MPSRPGSGVPSVGGDRPLPRRQVLRRPNGARRPVCAAKPVGRAKPAAIAALPRRRRVRSRRGVRARDDMPLAEVQKAFSSRAVCARLTRTLLGHLVSHAVLAQP
jgi:hypothetical protein